MNFFDEISLDEIKGKEYDNQILNTLEYGKASLTHYLHNSTNGVSKSYKQNALNFVKHALEYKFPDAEIDRGTTERALGNLLDEQLTRQVPFPAPEKPSFKFIDLFAGIGGFRIAAQSLGGKCVFTSEWDQFSQQTYFENFGEIPFGDITKDETKNFIPQNFDVLCAGFPCQPFSYAGLTKGFEDSTRGTLFFDILAILKKHQPKMFLLENVKGLKSHDNGKTMEIIEKSLQELGYNVQWEILNSYDFGLPQYRERWYCVGFKDQVNFSFPKGKQRGSKIKDIVDEKSNKDPRLALSAFETERINFHFKSDQIRVQHDNHKYEAHTKKGRHGVFSFQKPDGALRFHIGDAAKTQIQEAFYACVDTYAPTIIANRVPKLWDLNRKLSVLEAQRLQGFPDKYKFPVSDNQAYKQLGNSVAIPVLKAIFENMVNAIKTQ